jgi:hypothetical protein
MKTITPRFGQSRELLDFLQGAGGAFVRKIRVRSQLAPDFEYDPHAAAPPNPQPNWLLTLAKPEITLDTPSGPMVIAPYGTPEHQYGIPFVTAIGAFTLIGIFATGYFVWRRIAS